MAPTPIAFVTDYGTSDTYAAALAVAVWDVDPSLLAVTGTHGVPAGDVLAGAYHVKAMAAALPRGGVVCAVVDPGVGTDRRAIAVEAVGRRFVLPDNGLVSYVWDETAPLSRQAVSLPIPEDASATFHGRDVFAPAAARLAAGATLRDVGGEKVDPVLLDEAFARRASDHEVAGTVCVVDRFGNAITTVRDADLDGRQVGAVAWGEPGHRARVVRTYADIPDGGLAALVGSAGHWEIAARDRPAAERGGPRRGATVRMLLA